MIRPIFAKLVHDGNQARDEWRRLAQSATGIRTFNAREDVLCEGQRPKEVHLIGGGWACRYKHLPNGRRAIVGFLLPGDFCDLHAPHFGQMDHSIGALTHCTVIKIAHAALDAFTLEHPQFEQTLWRAIWMDQSISREWLVNMCQRSSEKKLAHLFCELRFRLSMIGYATENSYLLPMTQETLGDALGLSSVHVNRILQHLREERLVSLQERRLTIPDVARLERFAEFHQAYLEPPGREQAS